MACRSIHGKVTTSCWTGACRVTGGLNGAMDLDPGAGTMVANSNTADGVYIAKYSNVGNFIWGGAVIGGSIGLWPSDIKTDVQENV